MRIRIKFTKNEQVKYLGHLDIMRAFQRFFNCAGIRMEYSSGFNPHQIMHFAMPLGVGITSKAEYLDAQIADGQSTDIIRERLDKACGTAFDILNVRQLKEDAQKAMAAVAFASYSIRFKEYSDLHLNDYFSRDEIILSKKTKTGIHDVDVKALLIRLDQVDSTVYIVKKTGSQDSIKPELVFADIMAFNGLEYKRDEISICREELFGPEMIPLMDYQVIS